MDANWTFEPRSRSQKVRDPLVGEFFATSAIRNLAESIVREGIQNALDQGIRNEAGRFEENVTIRIELKRGKKAVNPAQHAQFFSGIWPHIQARGNGLSPDETPKALDDCPFLLFEDFNTTGLIGDVAQDRDIEGVKNPFFHFFRAEGRSAKSGDERGRWGVGKYVFPRASRIKTVFGFTVRTDDRRTMLMGSTVLRSHAVDDVDFLPDGLFGTRDKNEGDYFVLPEEDAPMLDAFREAFGIARRSEPGLSLVVPWIDESVTKDTLVSAVVSGYFAPLLDGSLKVSVIEDGVTTELNAETFMAEARRIGENETAILAALAEWGVFTKPDDHIELTLHAGNKPEWSDALLAEGRLEKLKAQLEGPSRRAAVRVPMRVREKGKEPRLTEFKIFFEEDRAADGRPVFVRDGILISDVRAPRDAGVRSLVIADDKPLSSLLGDAENPAHTQWQRESSNFRGKYDYGEACLRFVVQSAHEILARLRVRDEQGDPWLLADVFYLDDPAGEPDGSGKKQPEGQKKKEIDVPPPPPPPAKPKFYRVQPARSGFSLLPGTVVPPSLPLRLVLEIAYDVRKGNPFHKYAEDDFRLLQGPVRVEGKELGLKLVKTERNTLCIEIRDAAFAFTLTGFDTKRDLIVDVREEAMNNDSEN